RRASVAGPRCCDGGQRRGRRGVETLSLDVGRALVLHRRPRARVSFPRHAMTSSSLPPTTRAAMFLRLLAIQGAWNYETLLGNGIAFCVEPALRRLPGGIHGPAFKQAMARESRYFNAHPYLASV